MRVFFSKNKIIIIIMGTTLASGHPSYAAFTNPAHGGTISTSIPRVNFTFITGIVGVLL